MEKETKDGTQKPLAKRQKKREQNVRCMELTWWTLKIISFAKVKNTVKNAQGGP